MNNVYLKGTGDFTPDATPEPTDEQIMRAIRDNPAKVMQNALDSFAMEWKSAGIDWIASGLINDNSLREVLNKSAADLLFRGEI
jgi:hypothetical protein